MNRKVSNLPREFDTYHRYKPLNYSNKGYKTSHKRDKLMEKVSIDLMGLLPTGCGERNFTLQF